MVRAQLREERRRFPRLQTHLAVQMEQSSPGSGVHLLTSGAVLNVSRGGLLAEVAARPVQNRPIYVELEIDGERFRLWTRQVRTVELGPRRHQVAVEFDRRDQLAIESILGHAAAHPASVEPRLPAAMA